MNEEPNSSVDLSSLLRKSHQHFPRELASNRSYEKSLCLSRVHLSISAPSVIWGSGEDNVLLFGSFRGRQYSWSPDWNYLCLTVQTRQTCNKHLFFHLSTFHIKNPSLQGKGLQQNRKQIEVGAAGGIPRASATDFSPFPLHTVKSHEDNFHDYSINIYCAKWDITTFSKITKSLCCWAKTFGLRFHLANNIRHRKITMIQTRTSMAAGEAQSTVETQGQQGSCPSDDNVWSCQEHLTCISSCLQDISS